MYGEIYNNFHEKSYSLAAFKFGEEELQQGFFIQVNSRGIHHGFSIQN